MISSVVSGIRNDWRSLLKWLFVIFGGFWAVAQIVDLYFIGGMNPAARRIFFFVSVAVSALAALWLARSRHPHTTLIPGTKTKLTITVSDLFNYRGHIGLAVNEFFDSQLGDHVAKNSVHGQCIMRLFNGDSSRFDNAIRDSLSSATAKEVTRESGNRKQFPIGTTAVLDHGERRLFMVALCHTNLDDLKAHASATDLWNSLCELWRTVRSRGNGQPVAVPLIGSGISGIKISESAIAQMTVLSLQAVSQEDGQVTSELVLCVDRESFSRNNFARFFPDQKTQ